MRPQILVDFTQDKRAINGRVEHAAHSGFSRAQPFDALFDTLDRVDRIEGKKYVILISSGHDSFSRLTWTDYKED